MKSSFLSLALLLFAASASAKTVVTSFLVEGVDQGLHVAVRVPQSNNPVKDVNSNDLICNTGYIQPVSDTVINVPAGATVSAQFHKTSRGYLGPDPSDPIDPTNKGPVVAYMAAVPSALQTDVTGLQWFKVWEEGLNGTSHQWGSDRLFINDGLATFTIPSCIASGDYLVRVEHIALQAAYAYPGAQFYMGCAQIHVSGATSGGAVAPATVSFPGAYSSTDPGIVTSIFGLSSYPVPGPAVFQCPA